jgi:hypothetical protein
LGNPSEETSKPSSTVVFIFTRVSSGKWFTITTGTEENFI